MSDPIVALKQELLAAAERQQGHAVVDHGGRRLGSRLGRKRLLLMSTAALSVAAGLALFLSAPWSSSPSFLARARAALTAPAGMILYTKTESTQISTNPVCKVTRGPAEMWINQAPPHRYRALNLLNPPLPPTSGGLRALRASVCAPGIKSEVGGELDTGLFLRFVPPNELLYDMLPSFSPDPAQMLRDAIRSGDAQDEGRTRLRGRTVEHIRVDRPVSCPAAVWCFLREQDWYVDPVTFHPLEMHAPAGTVLPLGRRPPVVRFRFIVRYLSYAYLPRTKSNLALTNIDAQHPNARKWK
ncbi:MAG TPA: hypothetical protein VMT59_01865 [Gaiellaceae bacterium]|nr:hypothetical protein [Gaiellaceae bacterium]